MAQRSIPALPKTCIRKMPSKAALLKRTRAQRIPFRPGVRYSNKGRIHSRRPILSSAFFACKTAADHTFRVDGNSGLGCQRLPARLPGWAVNPVKAGGERDQSNGVVVFSWIHREAIVEP